MISDPNAFALLRRFLNMEPTPEDHGEIARRLTAYLLELPMVRERVDSQSVRELIEAGPDHWTEQGMEIARTWGEDLPVVGLPVFAAGILPIVFPEVTFPIGFDEVRYGCEPIDDPTVSDSARGVFDEMISEAREEGNVSSQLLLMAAKTIHFRTPDGVWHDVEGFMDRVTPMTVPRIADPSLDDWSKALANNWAKFLDDPVETAFSSLAMPQLWLPPSLGETRLHETTKSILNGLYSNDVRLDEIHWRTLEELVAELLHDRGLDVKITDRSGDGGRDVIARGELIPGEPMLMAVEVKHRQVVPLSELRQAMYANRHFPALMFVTSGRFTAGIYRERLEKDGMLRLILKDGNALSQWIDQYANRHFKDQATAPTTRFQDSGQ